MKRWNTKKGTINAGSFIKLRCQYCNKEFEWEQWRYNRHLKVSKGRGPFCSPHCALIARNVSEEQRKKISIAQKGKSVPARGRPGHVVTEETKLKIIATKKLISVKADWDIVHREAEYRGLTKYVTMQAPVPDIIYIDNGKLVAVEVEKKPWYTSIKTKMDAYITKTNYDVVYIVWYNLEGMRLKEWVLENGEWSLVE